MIGEMQICCYCELRTGSLRKGEIFCEGETLGGEIPLLFLILFILSNSFFFYPYQFLIPNTLSNMQWPR